jgi:hypothetical protein
VREVISQPITVIAANIRKFLSNIKGNPLSQDDARDCAAFFQHLQQEQVNNLVSGLFGIYTRADTASYVRQNINQVLPRLWPLVDEETRNHCGIRYGKYAANNDQQEKAFARQFLELVSGQSYLPADIRAAELERFTRAWRTANNAQQRADS